MHKSKDSDEDEHIPDIKDIAYIYKEYLHAKDERDGCKNLNRFELGLKQNQVFHHFQALGSDYQR